MVLDRKANDSRKILSGKNGGRKILKRGSAKRKVVVQLFGGVDRPFLITVILLLCLGTLMVFSASYPYANSKYDGDSYLFARKQITYALLGIAVMIFLSISKVFNYHFIRKFNKLIFAVSFLLLLSVLFIGIELNGAQRWIQLPFGLGTLQPSELVKFALVVVFADYADKYYDKIKTSGRVVDALVRVVPLAIMIVSAVGMFLVVESIVFAGILSGIIMIAAVVFFFVSKMREYTPAFYYGVLPFALVLGLVGVVMFLQNHMSGLIIMCAITMVMMFLAGTDLRYIVTGILVGGSGVFALALSKGYSSNRIKVWRDPFAHLLDGGWQPAQSLYAIGSGGFWGVGLGDSKQKHLYLPEPQNDYIFSVWCEEMGFVGAIAVICIFLFFIYRGILIALRAPDRFSSLLVMGIIMHVGIQMVLNIAVVTNSLPSTGISLPFFSYGGTSLVILLAEMGVVLSVSRYTSLEKS